jgi:WD40 repeat protein
VRVATTGGRAVFLLDLVDGRNRKMAEDESWARWGGLAFSPDKDRLVSVQHGNAMVEGSDDWVEEAVLTVWEVPTGRRLAREYLRGDSAEEGGLHDFPVGLAVSRTHLAWCGRHGTLALHDLQTLRPLSRIRLAEETTEVAFSPDGSTLVATGHHGVRIASVVQPDR